MSVMGDKLLNENFLSLFLEKNSDGTKHLRLLGKELYQRFGSRLKPRHMKTIANFMRTNPEITSAEFSYNDFGDKGLETLTEHYFNEPNTLQSISLMQCDITAIGVAALACSSHLRLKTCRVNGNKIAVEGARYLAKLISSCPTLENLDMAETDQTLESIESLLIVLEKTPLKVLDISRIIPNSFYTRYNQATLAHDLEIAIKVNSTLRELHIQKMEFDGHDVDILLNGLKQNVTLQVLDLGFNNIADYGTELLASWLRHRPVLKGLNLAGNGIGDLGARAMSFGIPFSNLRFLDISGNFIKDQGVTDLLDSLKKTPMIRIFFLWGNRWGQMSSKKLYRLIRTGVIEQQYIDVKVYISDDQYHAVRYPANIYKFNYYSVTKVGCPEFLKIHKNVVESELDQPRALLNLPHIGRYPKVDKKLGPRIIRTSKCKEDEQRSDGERN